MIKVAIWDLPLRLFHWLLVLVVIGLIVTAKLGGNLMECHGKLGVLALGLVFFRVIWGFIGSTHARFVQFFPTPNAIKAYLRGEWQGLGHNPLGALSVIALLALLLLQATSGLFANDDIAFQGPLYALISSELSERLTGLHEVGASLLLLLVAVHISAIVYYVRVKKDNLLRPMITGEKDVEVSAETQSYQLQGGGILALVVALALALVLVWLINSGLLLQWFAPPPINAAPAAW